MLAESLAPCQLTPHRNMSLTATEYGRAIRWNLSNKMSGWQALVLEKCQAGNCFGGLEEQTKSNVGTGASEDQPLHLRKKDTEVRRECVSKNSWIYKPIWIKAN
ncbi:hypothetical protein Y1Q_0012709 [Alligator mississippiensis]|uniref:Uncharacterized protein n=1 Tax=Alligator mississippiensis TaxID=8496 RepID=A0A151M8N0_ALLMI|nr:hypothetical protein Y1Q_0012709 [Alligator mississippiensis]